MAVGDSVISELLPVKGVKLSASTAGLYKKNRLDTAIIELQKGSSCSAVFTRNAFCAAPVKIARKHIALTTPRYLIINAGNANAGMGVQGEKDVLEVCSNISKLTQCTIEAILPFSTGVIGEPLPVDKIANVIPDLLKKLNEDAWIDVANAMLTTDTRPKGVSKNIKIEGQDITITGICKGSGMIKPNMATMLSYIATDAKIEKDLLNKILSEAVNRSFNRISVDGDTSTNDAFVVIATGQSTAPEISADNNLELIQSALTDVSIQLAKDVVRDGEGATKLITIEVNQGKCEEECLAVANAIANSPLVKTAFFASDANWGRILAAIGNAGVENLDINNISINLDDINVVSDGGRSDKYNEVKGQKIMQQDEITIHIYLKRGDASVSFWTCDLSHEYVKINAEYRT